MKPHHFLDALDYADFTLRYGQVSTVGGGVIEATGPSATIGALCAIATSDGGSVAAEVAAVDRNRIVLIPFDPVASIRLGARVTALGASGAVPVGDGFAGRAVDALGRPIDGGAQIPTVASLPLDGAVPRPMDRADPAAVLHTGIRAIDGLLTLGVGQRVGIFAASGVGKTSLVEQLATQTRCDRVVLCLVGERGREVEAMWRLLRAREDRRRFTLVAATSDESPALRVRSVQYALCLAEHWRTAGDHVVVMIDSVTRMAMALREIGLAAGAPPTIRAYTPNVFAALPRIVERCGALAAGGATTAIMTVLSETDDVDDPIVELMKSLLDGHIVLSRTLADQGHFPAIDIVRSISRLSERLVTPRQGNAASNIVAQLSAYDEARVMIESGVYKAGTNPAVDRAIGQRPAINALLRQSRREDAAFDDTVRRLTDLAAQEPAHG